MKQWKILVTFAGVFFLAYYLPLSNPKVKAAILEAFKMLQWYAREHTLTCVVPALFIAGGIVTFLSRESVLRHLGPSANKAKAYGVASVSGTVLAVCSCSVLPMFAGIYRIGAGIGPATTFLYAGPAINVLALFLTARVLGIELGLARAIGAIVFGIVIGLLMAMAFGRSRRAVEPAPAFEAGPAPAQRPLWKSALYFGAMIAFLVFSDWYNPGDVTVTLEDGSRIEAVLLQETRDEVLIQVAQPAGELRVGDKLTLARPEIGSLEKPESLVRDIYRLRWYLSGAMALVVLLMVWRWFERREVAEWMRNTWDFSKLLLPLLFGGVFAVGFIGAVLPDEQVARWVGDNSLSANLAASLVGCLFYFATLTEIPILQALMEHGMAPGPSLALLLAGPALSLPSILVIRSVMGNRKTLVFTVLVVVMATVVGLFYGFLVPGVSP